jgi:hypothetical protein
MATLEEMKQELSVHKEEWKTKYKVTDISIGLKESGGILTNELCYQFWVNEKKVLEAMSADEVIPKTLFEKKTDVWVEKKWYSQDIVPGTIPMDIPTNVRVRPIQPGCGVGNEKITQGTPGALYKIPGLNKKFLLSNGHVLAADPFNYIKNQSSVACLQPGPYGGGSNPADYIGNLRFMMLLNDQTDGAVPPVYSIGCIEDEINYVADGQRFVMNTYNDGTISSQGAAPNTADCALCELADGVDMIPTPIDEKDSPKTPSCILQPGQKVKLTSWRMNGTTCGVVTSVGKSAQVNYSNNKVANYVDLIVTTKIGEPGTSGSGVITDDEAQAFGGLNFAGDGSMNLVCSIQHINAAFGGSVVCVDGSTDPIEPPPQPPENEIWDIHGLIVDEDMNPIEGAEVVTLSDLGVKTDQTGAYRIEYVVAPGTPKIVDWIEVYKPGYYQTQQIASIEGKTQMNPIVLTKIKKERKFIGNLNFFGIQMPITGVLTD